MLPAFGTLVVSHRGEILRYLTRLLGSRVDAEDVSQDTWIRAQRAYGRLPAGADARAWLYRIATNRALTAIGQRRRQTERMAPGALDGIGAEPTSSPEGRDELLAVARAMQRLPPKQQAALVQRRLHGRSYPEIAASLGCSAESARANVYQAIRKLRLLLAAGHENPRAR